jgi:predicted regulator of Ras-like GTPase activity (Roadblock/LC7/MglB family)
MKAGLQEINETLGVWGSLLCNNQGELIENASPPALNKDTLENISRHMLELISGAAESVPGLTEITFHYQDRKMLVVDLRQALLMVICTPSVDISLLRMSINVVLARWESDSDIQKNFKDYYVDRL